MSQLDHLFAQLRQTGRKAFMPFVTAGTRTCVYGRGAASCRPGCLCELGILRSGGRWTGNPGFLWPGVGQDVKLAGIFDMLWA